MKENELEKNNEIWIQFETLEKRIEILEKEIKELKIMFGSVSKKNGTTTNNKTNAP